MWWKHAIIYLLISILNIWVIKLHFKIKRYNKEYGGHEYSVSGIWFDYAFGVIVLIISDIYIWIN